MSDEDAQYRWKLLPGSEDKWSRACWGGERFFHQYSRWTKGHADAIGILTISVPGVKPAALRELLYASLIHSLFTCPLLAATVECGVNPELDPWLGAWVYTSRKDTKHHEEWVKRAVTWYEPKDGQTFEQLVDAIRYDRPLHAAQESMPSTFHIVLPKDDNDGRCSIIFHGTHYIYDGQSNFNLTQVMLSFLAKHREPEAAWKEARSHPWGQEINNLPLTLPDSIGITPSECDDPEQAAKALGPELAGHGPGLGLPPQRTEARTAMGYAFQERRILTAELSQAFNRACRSLGFTSGHGLDAVRHVAVYTIRQQDAIKAGETLPNTHIINFMLPIDFRRYFKKELLGKPYVCTGTAGFTTEISLDHIRAREGEQDLSEAHLDRAWKEVAPLLRAQYNAVANDKEILKAMIPVGEMLGVNNEEWPPFEMINPGDAFTSLGKLESRLQVNYTADGTKEGPVTVKILDWFNTSRLTRPQVGFHTWLWGGRIHLNVNHSDHYDAEYVKRYVDTVEGLIVSAARKYGGEQQKPAPQSSSAGRPGQNLAPMRPLCDCNVIRAKL